MIAWLTAFIDMPADTFEAGARFWESVTGSTRSAVRGDDGEFATLDPADGDAFLRVQRVRTSRPGVHLDIHVDDITTEAARAVELGAAVIAAPNHVVMSSPGGFVFCFVHHHGESIRPSPFSPQLDEVGEASSSADQVCIDVPAEAFAEEVVFWSALMEYEHRSARPEFVHLARPANMPLRLLLQRLGEDDQRSGAEGHLDIGCGENVDVMTRRHVELGAVVERVEQHWTTLRDPAGLPYCLTRRDPVTGIRAG